jgi:exodeoxyribonuclease VII small subunit
MMAKNTAPIPVAELTYEAALNELEQIVSSLEDDQNSLEAAMLMFERGQSLLQRCEGLLDQAELKVKQLTGDTLVDFENEE